jgi:Tol biopolymer transport system component
VDYSRDQQWLAYVSYPDKSLWKIRSDGSQNTQLTFPPLKVNQPHWSPKGDAIAVMGQLPDGRHRVLIVPSQGGPAKQAIETGIDQGVPTYSPDGTQIAFGQLREHQPPEQMTVQILDLGSHELSVVPGSEGVWTPRWSPDGRFLAGMTPDFRKLLLFDFHEISWKIAAELVNIDDPVWSPESNFIYFRAADAVTRPGQDQLLAIFRLNMASRKVERVAGIRNLPVPANGEVWFGLTPDLNPLSMRALQTHEIYAMDLK